jgi:hypothetical protein
MAMAAISFPTPISFSFGFQSSWSSPLKLSQGSHLLPHMEISGSRIYHMGPSKACARPGRLLPARETPAPIYPLNQKDYDQGILLCLLVVALAAGRSIASASENTRHRLNHIYLSARLSWHGGRPSTPSARSALQSFDVHAETLEDKFVR